MLAACQLAVVLLSGCAGSERSRDLADPAVPAVTLARQVCSNCHGPGGNSVSPNFPRLAGQVEPYLAAQLTAFRSHDRRDPAGFEYMWGLSRSLTDAQIQGLAVYYSGQAPARQPLEGSAAQREAGRAIFEHGVESAGVPACAGCHGAEGQGAAAAGGTPFPRLAGQHADYVAKQLRVFQRTDERPAGAVMKVVAHALSAQNIVDVAAYVHSIGNR